MVHLNPAHPERKDTQTEITEPTSFFYAPLPLLHTSVSDLLQGRGSLLNLEDRASQGVPGHLRALSSLWDPPNQEHPETDGEQGDLKNQ